MTLLLLLARLLLSIVFLVAGLAKLADLAGSRQAMRGFGNGRMGSEWKNGVGNGRMGSHLYM